MRRALDIGAALVVAAFVIGGLVWFIISARAPGPFKTEDAFIGLGFLASVLAIGLAAVAFVLIFIRGGDVGDTPTAGSRQAARADRGANTRDRDIVITQLRYGTFLIALGALLGVVFGVVINDPNNVAVAMGTAAIGAGAALIPAGAAASASARILSTLPQQQKPATADDGSVVPAGDDAAGDTAGGVVDEVETYGAQSPTTGQTEADVESSLAEPALADHELTAEDGTPADDDIVEAAEPAEPEAAVASLAGEDVEEAEEGAGAEGAEEPETAADRLEDEVGEEDESAAGAEDTGDDEDEEPPPSGAIHPDDV
jgi:hypothetical protein